MAAIDSRTHYTDSSSADVSGTPPRSAIEWARAIFEESPAAMRTALPPAWRVLGLDLGSRHDPGRVLGWPIVVDRPDEVVLGTRSRLGVEARLTIAVDDSTVGFGTAIRYENRLGRAVWIGVAPVHRLIVGRLLQHAVAARG